MKDLWKQNNTIYLRGTADNSDRAGKTGAILPARLPNHSVEFGLSYPLTELAMS